MFFASDNAAGIAPDILAAIAGALLMAAAGTARITLLRRIMRRDRRKPHAS